MTAITIHILRISAVTTVARDRSCLWRTSGGCTNTSLLRFQYPLKTTGSTHWDFFALFVALAAVNINTNGIISLERIPVPADLGKQDFPHKNPSCIKHGYSFTGALPKLNALKSAPMDLDRTVFCSSSRARIGTKWNNSRILTRLPTRRHQKCSRLPSYVRSFCDGLLGKSSEVPNSLLSDFSKSSKFIIKFISAPPLLYPS